MAGNSLRLVDGRNDGRRTGCYPAPAMSGNEREARELLRDELARWRRRRHDELAARIDAEPATGELTGPSGTAYGFEIQVVWDAAPGGNLRVLASIDGGGLRALRPWCDDFILAPDGTFVGEEPG